MMPAFGTRIAFWVELSALLVCLVLGDIPLRAQSTFNGQIVPGLSTRDDVEEMIGKPTKVLGATVAEYKPTTGIRQLQIEFQDTGIVNRIAAVYAAQQTRNSLMQSLHFSGQPQATKVLQGQFREYFGAPVFLALVHTSAGSESGVSGLVYFTPDAFSRDLASAGSSPSAASAPAAPLYPASAPAAPPPAPSSGGLKRPAATPSSHSANPAGCLNQVTLNLLTPINSSTSKLGDKIVAQAISPDGIRGDVVTGQIRAFRCGTNAGGVPGCDLFFSVDSLSHQGQELQMDTQFLFMSNSQGQPNGDENENPVMHVDKGGYAKVLAQEAMMASNGGNSNGPIMRTAIELTTNSAQFSLAPGSHFVVILHSRTMPIPELQCGRN